MSSKDSERSSAGPKLRSGDPMDDPLNPDGSEPDLTLRQLLSIALVPSLVPAGVLLLATAIASGLGSMSFKLARACMALGRPRAWPLGPASCLTPLRGMPSSVSSWLVISARISRPDEATLLTLPQPLAPSLP